jgi:adenine-specific DNA-methyltransferase
VIEVICGDALEVMAGMDANSVDLIVTDPPYYRVKAEWWDRQWDTRQGFIRWMGKLAKEWQRILKPNGSLYVFASPKMAARVEVKLATRFEVLNRIRWVKDAGWHNKMDEAILRSWLSPWEEVIFCEHYGDRPGKGYDGYNCIREYLDGERIRAGVTPEQCNEICGFRREGGMAGRHYFSASQWALPTEANYLKLRDGFHRLNHGGDYLRREYEDLRRPFQVTADVPYTDVWTFPTVGAYPGKHPCEKPIEMMRHIVKASSRPGAVVLDCFCGSGNTLRAAQELGRDCIGVDIDPHWCDVARQRLAATQPALIQEAQLETTP